jgi:hypothetical protein
MVAAVVAVILTALTPWLSIPLAAFVILGSRAAKLSLKARTVGAMPLVGLAVAYTPPVVTFLLFFLSIIYLTRRAKKGDLTEAVKMRSAIYAKPGKLDKTYLIPPITSKYDISKVEFSKGAKFRQKSDFTPKVRPYVGGQVIAPVCTASIPTVYKSNERNMEIAIKARVLLKVPVAIFPWALSWIVSYVRSALEFFEGSPILEPRLEESDLDVLPEGWTALFDDWNKHFPPNKQRTNSRAMKEIMDGREFTPFVEAFVKRENELLISMEEFEPQRPRLISGIDKWTKVCEGPFARAMSKMVAKEWDTDNYICYAGGLTTVDLDDWINFHEEPVYVWIDYSKFDLTQGKECFRFEIDFLESLGADRVVPHWEKIKNMYYRTKGRYKNIFEYVIVTTRKSGSNFTSILNSWINGIVWLMSVFLFFVRKRYPLATLKEIHEDMLLWWGRIQGPIKEMQIALFSKWIKCILMGDDNLTTMDGRRYPLTDARKLFEAMLSAASQMGFKLTGGFSANPLDMDFLNMIAYPTMWGLRFGKKPGRNICKACVILARGHPWKEKDRIAILRSNLISALPTANHVPFLRVYVNTLLDYIGRDGPMKRIHYFRDQWKGKIKEADSLTWAYFEQKTGLNITHEFTYATTLSRALAKWGLMCVYRSEEVEILRKNGL